MTDQSDLSLLLICNITSKRVFCFFIHVTTERQQWSNSSRYYQWQINSSVALRP